MNPTVGTMVIGIVNFVGALTAIVPLKFFGRKSILIAGHTIMTIALLLIGVSQVANMNMSVLIFLFVFLLAY